MKKRQPGRKLSRKKAHREALIRNLAQDLFIHERIRTTLPKAKELRPFAEKLITKSRLGSNHARNQVAAILYKKEAVTKLMDDIGPRFEEENRPGGYIRIIKLGKRQGDGVEEAIIELIESESTKSQESKNQ